MVQNGHQRGGGAHVEGHLGIRCCSSQVEYILYKMYSWGMTSVSLSEFRNQQSEYLAQVHRGPVEILSRGAKRRAVVVSPEFFDRALEALEIQEDIRDAAVARTEERVSHQDLRAQLGF